MAKVIENMDKHTYQDSTSDDKSIGLDFVHFLAFFWRFRKMVGVGALVGAFIGLAACYFSKATAQSQNEDIKTWQVDLNFNNTPIVSEATPLLISNYLKIIDERDAKKAIDSRNIGHQDKSNFGNSSTDKKSVLKFRTFKLHGQQLSVLLEAPSEIKRDQIETSSIEALNSLVSDYNQYVSLNLGKLISVKIQEISALARIKMEALKLFEKSGSVPSQLKKEVLTSLSEDISGIAKVEVIVFLLSTSQTSDLASSKIATEYSEHFENYITVQNKIKSFLKAVSSENFSGSLDTFASVQSVKPIQENFEYTNGKMRPDIFIYIVGGMLLGSLVALAMASVVSFYRTNYENLKIIFQGKS